MMFSYKFGQLARCFAAAVVIGSAGQYAMAAQDWSAPWQVALDDSFEDVQPRVAVDEAGNVVAVWLRSASGSASHAMVASSFDGGVSFTPPYFVSDAGERPVDHSTVRGLPRNGEQIPVTAADVVYAGNNNWLCFWTQPSAVADEYDVAVKRSANNGLTWSAKEVLYTGPLGNGSLDVASDKAGNIIATFNTRLLRSSDYGMTWQPMSDPFSISIDIPHDSAAHLKSTIATNGSGDWVQAYTVFFSYGLTNYVQILASVSTDNGQTWNETLRKQRIFFIMDHDVAMVGDTAVIAVTPTSPQVYVTSNAGASWSDAVNLPQYIGIALGLSLTGGDGHWTLFAPDIQSNRILSYVTDDPFNWSSGPERVTTDDAEENFGAIAALPGGNVVALLETTRNAEGTQGPDSDIYATVLNNGGSVPPPASGPDIVMSSGEEPKVKFNRKWGEYQVNWKTVATNAGEVDAEGFVVRFWISTNGSLDSGDTLVSEQFVKSVRAAKPSKKAKSKKIKLKSLIGDVGAGYVIAEVVNPAEPASANNFATEHFIGVF